MAAELVVATLDELCRGVVDACALHRVARVLVRSTPVRTHFWHCVLLNGCIFLGSILILQDALVPSLRQLLTVGDADSHQPLLVLLPFAQALYQALWLLPAYAICIVVNMLWFNDLSKSAFAFRESEGALKGGADSGRDASGPAPQRKGLSYTVGSELWRTLIFVSFLAQIFLVGLLPGVGVPLSFLMTCWMNAFYSFDSKWAMLEWDLEKRLACFERAWAYFAGFGLPHTLLTFFLPTLKSAAVWSLFFPFVLGAMSAEHDGEAAAARSRAAGLFRLGIWRWTSSQCHALLDLAGYGVGGHLLWGGKGGAAGGGGGKGRGGAVAAAEAAGPSAAAGAAGAAPGKGGSAGISISGGSGRAAAAGGEQLR